MARGIPGVLVLKGARQLRTVTHPLRLEIIERLQVDGPDSIAGLARKLDRRANALTYHVRLLERAGAVVRSGTRRAGRRGEVVYAVAAPRIALAADAGSASMLRAAAGSAGAVLRMAEREIRRALEGGLCASGPLAGRPLGRRIKTWLTDRDLGAVQRKLEQLDRHLAGMHRKKKGRPYAVTIVVVPIGPERKP